MTRITTIEQYQTWLEEEKGLSHRNRLDESNGNGWGGYWKFFKRDLFGIPMNTPFWQLRERHMRYEGLRKFLPSSVYRSLRFYIEDADDIMSTYYPYICESDSSKIGLTPNESYGKEDRQLVLKPGKFFTQYCKIEDNNAVRDLVDLYYEETGHGLTFGIAATEDEVVDVYQNGPASCMNNEKEYTTPYRLKCYRVYAGQTYGHGWGVAYLKNRAGHYKARAVVNDGYFQTIYGEGQAAGILERRLIEEGYSEIVDWEGYSLPLIKENFEEDSVYILPYVDGSSNGVLREDYIEIGYDEEGYSIDIQSLRGYFNPPKFVECSHCYKEVPDHDINTVATIEESDVALCDTCLNHEYNYVYGRDAYVLYDNLVETENGRCLPEDVIEIDGLQYDKNLLKTCFITGKLLIPSEAIQIIKKDSLGRFSYSYITEKFLEGNMPTHFYNSTGYPILLVESKEWENKGLFPILEKIEQQMARFIRSSVSSGPRTYENLVEEWYPEYFYKAYMLENKEIILNTINRLKDEKRGEQIEEVVEPFVVGTRSFSTPSHLILEDTSWLITEGDMA